MLPVLRGASGPSLGSVLNSCSDWEIMRAKRCALYGTIAWCLLFLGRTAAQPPQENPPQDSGATLRVETTLVQIPVSVTDSVNRFVLGLQKEDFHLFEDGVEQEIAHFSGEEAPLSVGLVFDESGSMDYKLQTAQAAAAQLLKTMNGDDEAFLVEFSDTAKLSVGFTSNTEEIQKALKTAQPGGLTAMLDAVNLALGQMKKAKNSRKAIVIISDGGDNHSHYRSAQIEALVREADVQIYAMGVFDPLSSLVWLPKKSRGRACFPKSPRRPADGPSPRRSQAICPASRPGLPSSCAMNMCLATTRRTSA